MDGPADVSSGILRMKSTQLLARATAAARNDEVSLSSYLTSLIVRAELDPAFLQRALIGLPQSVPGCIQKMGHGEISPVLSLRYGTLGRG